MLGAASAGSYGILSVYVAVSGTLTQSFQVTGNGAESGLTDVDVFARSSPDKGTTWTVWVPVTARLWVQNVGSDFNAATAPGTWYFDTSCVNGPTASPPSGVMVVSSLRGGPSTGTGGVTYLIQTTTYATSGQQWMRTRGTSAAWSAWRRIDNQVPAGGTTGQYLTKKSATDWDLQWTTLSGLVPVGGAVGAPLIKNSATDLDTKWGIASQLLTTDTTGAHLAADLSTAYPSGTSQCMFTTAQASAGGWPINNYCQVITVRDGSGGTACSQWCLGSVPAAAGLAYFRSGNSSGWSSWMTVAEDTGWIPLGLASGFTNICQYRRLNGIVYWNGQVNGTFTAGSSSVINTGFAVPAGFKGTGPYVIKAIATSTSGAFARCYLNNSASSGAITVQIPTGASAPSYIEIDGLGGYPADA